jgi:superfamily II DNA or RNA helicase
MSLTKSQIYNLRILKKEMSSQLIERGKLLLQKGMVTFDYFDPELECFYFLVKGNVEPYYQVSIGLMENGWDDEIGYFVDDVCDCNCFYFLENLECKHVAAALLFLEVNNGGDYFMEGNNNLLSFTKLNEEGTGTRSIPLKLTYPLEILCSQSEIINLADKMPTLPDTFFYAVLEDVIILENGYNYSVNIQGQLHEISVEYLDGKVIIDGSNNRGSHVIQGLQWLKKRYTNPKLKDLLLLSSSQRREAMDDYLQHFGLDEQIKNPMEALTIAFTTEGIILIPKGPIRGFYDVDVVSSIMEKNLFKSSQLTEEKLEYIENESEWGRYNAAFALVLDFRGDLECIIAFMAKGSKNDPRGLNVKFTLLEDPEDKRLRDNLNLGKIFLAVNKVNRSIKKKDVHLIHDQFGEFLQLTSDYKLYYFQGYNKESQNPKKRNLRHTLQVLPTKLAVKIRKVGLLIEVLVILKSGEQEYLLEEINERLESNPIYATFLNQLLFYLRSPEEMKVLEFWREFPVIQVLESNLDNFINNILLPMSKNVEIIDEAGLFQESEGTGKLQRELYVTELTGLVIFRPSVKYGENAFSNPLEGNSILDPDTKTLYLRDEDIEDEYLAFLRDLHPSFKRGGGQGFFHLTHEAFMDKLWFMKAFELLKKNGVSVLGLENIKIKKYSPFPPEISMEFGSSQDWFEVNAKVAYGNNKVKLKDIKKALEKDNNFVELSDGTIGILPEEWIKKFNRLFRTGETSKEEIKIAKTQFNLLDDLPELTSFPEVLQEIEEKKERLKTFTEIQQTSVPKQLKASLRNYQHVGLNWLNFLQEYGWGGILADDMGLGKTLQVIAMICKIVEKTEKRVLVIVPTTLLFNWKSELEKFAPHIDYFIHHGNRYDKVEELSKHQVVLTSYGLVINDLDLLKQIEFEAIIADESQAIKNVNSQRYKAITKLKGKFKVALTGTPIENGLGELYAQMNFVNPGFFQNFKGFTNNFLLPLKKGNAEILSELQRKIQPFILRRTKKEVLTELPEKTEEYLFCEMDAVQRKVYDAYRNEYRNYLLKKFEEEGVASSKMFVLEGLTRLRQVCDSTTLVPNNDGKFSSAKIDTLLEHITEKTGNHKILVFSQFVKMLDIVQEKLKENEIEYAYLDGKTSLKEREARVNEFQNDQAKRVFLISLKAGGTGLNLTAADYVYILDPWWNPAVENQAIDRCYRMGQEKHVIAYRMVCTNTIEEKIMLLQQAKTKMAKEVIAEGDSFLGSLDGDGMLALFD